MVATCAVCKKPYVKKSTIEAHEQVSFHKFPREPELRSSWVKSIQQYIPRFQIPVDGKLCSRHFKTDDFYVAGWNGIPRLKDTAVPSVFSLVQPIPSKVPSQPRPILPKPTLVSLEDSVDIKDVFLTKQKKLEIGDKVFCRVGDKLVPGLVENVKCVNVSSTPAPKPEFVDINHYGDGLEPLTVKSEVASDPEEDVFEPQEDEVAVENEVFSYSEFHSDMNDIPEYEITPIVKPIIPQVSRRPPTIIAQNYSEYMNRFCKLNTKRIEVPIPPEKRIILTESNHVNKRFQVTIPGKCPQKNNQIVEHSQSFDLDMSEIPEYECKPSGKRKTHQVPLIEAPQIKVLKNSHCNSSPPIRSLLKHPDERVQIQNTTTLPVDHAAVTTANATSKHSVQCRSLLKRPEERVQIQNTTTMPVHPVILTTANITARYSVDEARDTPTPPEVPSTCADTTSNVIYSIPPVNNLFAYQPSASVQPQNNPPSSCPTFFMLTPQMSQNNSTLQLGIPSNQLLPPAGNSSFMFLKPPIMSSQVSAPSSTSSTPSSTTASPVYATSSFISPSTPGLTAALIQNLLPQLGMSTSCLPNPSTTSTTSIQSSTSSTQSSTPPVFTTSSVLSQPTPGVQSSQPTSSLPNVSEVASASTTSENPSSNEQPPAKSSDSIDNQKDKSNASEFQTQQDDDIIGDISLPFETTESILESTGGIEDDDSIIAPDKRTAAVLCKLRKILKERKASMRAMSFRLKRREKKVKVLTEQLAKFKSLSKPTPEHQAAEILSKKYPTCIQHLMSRIASISDYTDKKPFKYSKELKDFLVKLRFSNDPYAYLNSKLMNELPSDDVLNEWANSSGLAP